MLTVLPVRDFRWGGVGARGEGGGRGVREVARGGGGRGDEGEWEQTRLPGCKIQMPNIFKELYEVHEEPIGSVVFS